MKKITNIFIILAILFCFNSLSSYALEVDTHRDINKKIADGTINEFSLNNYLKNNLGFQNGVKEVFTSYGESKMVLEWLGKGGITEDKPTDGTIDYFRSTNHFHDPLSNKGFGGFLFGTLFKGVSSITWSQKPIGTQSPGGYYSWHDTRDYFYQALTSATKTNREKYFAETFRGVGQLMHLVQDASVPAHTRNEFHAGYHYEVWVDENKSQLLNLSPIPFDPSILKLTGSLAPLPISNIFDSEKYTGTNPDPSITTISNNIGLTEYVNANFFSDMTIFQNYPHPAKENTSAVLRERESEDGVLDRVYYIQGYQSDSLAAYSYFKNLDISGIPEGWKYNLDNTVYADYASLLIPRAVSYSAGLINYFFRGDIDMIHDNTTGSGYVIENKSEEDMNGTFELWYDDENGARKSAWKSPDNFSVSKKGKSENITFPEPSDAGKRCKYILVFRGQMGQEKGAVVGKVVKGVGCARGRIAYLVVDYRYDWGQIRSYGHNGTVVLNTDSGIFYAHLPYEDGPYVPPYNRINRIEVKLVRFDQDDWNVVIVMTAKGWRSLGPDSYDFHEFEFDGSALNYKGIIKTISADYTFTKTDGENTMVRSWDDDECWGKYNEIWETQVLVSESWKLIYDFYVKGDNIKPFFKYNEYSAEYYQERYHQWYSNCVQYWDSGNYADGSNTYAYSKQEIRYGDLLIDQSVSECRQEKWIRYQCPTSAYSTGWVPSYRNLEPYRAFNEDDYAYTDNGAWKSSLAFLIPGITEIMARNGNGYSFFSGAQSFSSESEAENCGGFLLQGKGKIGFLVNQDVNDQHVGKLVKFNTCSDYKTLEFENVIGPLKVWNYSRDFIMK